jgi:[calcium/calmodulin-dependent protein kinase] kinase
LYGTQPPDSNHPPKPEKKSTAEYAAYLLREREQFLATVGKTGLDRLRPLPSSPSHPSTDPTALPLEPPRLLGIGTGGIDSFGSEADLPVADVVSDSPTAVDFNIYDRAYEAEVERIKRSASVTGGRRGRAAAAAAAAGQMGRIYRTRLNDPASSSAAGGGSGEGSGRAVEHYKVGDGEGVVSEPDNGEKEEKAETKGERRMPRSLFDAFREMKRPGKSMFADVAAQAMLEAKKAKGEDRQAQG